MTWNFIHYVSGITIIFCNYSSFFFFILFYFFFQFLYLEFLDFDVEFHPLCLWDYLAVVEGECTASLKPRYCGGMQQVPTQKVLNSSDACLKFVSDFIYPKRGFRLLIRTTGKTIIFPLL